MSSCRGIIHPLTASRLWSHIIYFDLLPHRSIDKCGSCIAESPPDHSDARSPAQVVDKCPASHPRAPLVPAQIYPMVPGCHGSPVAPVPGSPVAPVPGSPVAPVPGSPCRPSARSHGVPPEGALRIKSMRMMAKCNMTESTVSRRTRPIRMGRIRRKSCPPQAPPCGNLMFVLLVHCCRDLDGTRRYAR